MESSTLLAFIVGLFLIINLIIGIWAGRNVKTTEEYEVGKKKWSTGSLVMTYLATILGGGMAYRDALSLYNIGIMAFLTWVSISISHFIRAIFLANQIGLFSDCRSLGDFFEKLYGRYSRYFVGFLSFVYGCLIVGLQIRVLSLFFTDFLEWDPTIATIFSGLVITIYTAFGGMKAVIATDIFQFVMMFGALFIISAYSVWKAGGIISLMHNLPKNLLQFSGSTDITICWSLIILDAIFSYEIAEPARFHRLLMAKNKNTFRKLFIFVGIGNFLGFGLICLSSFALASIFNGSSEISNPILYITKNFIPVSFIPVVNIGIIAIVLSSGDSWLHTTGCSFARDLVEPFGKKISLFKLKIIVFTTGILSIWLAFNAHIIFFNLGTLLSIIAPVISAPVFLGFLGFKTSSRMFWLSAISSILTFIWIKIFADCYMPMNLAISTSISFIVYISTHLFENHGLKMVGNSIFSFHERESFMKKLTFNSLNIDNQNYTQKPFFIFGLLYLFILATPYIFGYSQEPSSELFFYFRFLGIILCSLLLCKSIFPKSLKKYQNLFFYITVTYCVPFMSTLSFLLNPYYISSIISVSLSLVSLLLFLNWKKVILLNGIGIFFATLLSMQIFSDSLTTIDSNILYTLVTQVIFTIIFGAIVGSRRDKNTLILNQKNNFLEKIQTDTIASAHKSMTLQAREESQFNYFIALPSAKEKIAQMIKIYKDSSDRNSFQKDLQQLSESIEADERTKIYQVLAAKRYNLTELAYKCEETLKIAGCDDVSINIFSEKTFIRCDETSILKMCYKIANDYCRKIYLENSGDDNDLILSFFDTKINYQSDEETNNKKLFDRTIDGICIVLSEREISEKNNFTDKIYVKKLTDLEAIEVSKTEDINLTDIERGIDAHYGILENHSDINYLMWVSILPADVYEIRPETLDMTEPINVKYNWPAAVELEKKIAKELQSFADLNFSKIDHAVSVIKKYHFHQTRKSGEPYYMHPIHVALVVLNIMREKDSELHEEFNRNIENLIISALLHDILEDTAYSKRALTRNFGAQIRDLVLEVTKIDHTNRSAMLSNKQAFQDLIEKEPLALCIKLADRMHNIMTIDGHSKIEKRKAIADETLNFFVPPAKKLGLLKIAHELEEASNYVLKNGKIYGYTFE